MAPFGIAVILLIVSALLFASAFAATGNNGQPSGPLFGLACAVGSIGIMLIVTSALKSVF